MRSRFACNLSLPHPAYPAVRAGCRRFPTAAVHSWKSPRASLYSTTARYRLSPAAAAHPSCVASGRCCRKFPLRNTSVAQKRCGASGIHHRPLRRRPPRVSAHRDDRQLHRETQRREFALTDIIIGDPDPQRRQAIDRIAFRLSLVKRFSRRWRTKSLIALLARWLMVSLVCSNASLTWRNASTSSPSLISHPVVHHSEWRSPAGKRVCRPVARLKSHFSGPGNQFGDCLGKFTHTLSLHLRLLRAVT